MREHITRVGVSPVKSIHKQITYNPDINGGNLRKSISELRCNLGHQLTKDSSLLLHTIHSLSNGGFLKIFKNTCKKISETRKLESICE
jgi:hypothetical protein